MYYTLTQTLRVGLCGYIYTGERNFCVNLNAAFTKKLPVDLPPFNGNHAGLYLPAVRQTLVYAA